MAVNRRAVLSIVVLALLGVFVGIGVWYESRKVAPNQAEVSAAIAVTNGEDRGAGSLREALFIAAAAKGRTTISINVPKITLATTLPPIINALGVSIVAGQQNAEIDASALTSGPVLDVASTNVSIEGLRIRNGKAAGILLRAGKFRLASTTIQACDVGIDIGENATEILLEQNRFAGNRVGVRFAGSNKNTSVLKNEFAAHRDAAIWAVRGAADSRRDPISIRDNRFTKERIGVLTSDVAIALESNDFLNSGEAAMQLMGTGAVARGNRISGSEAMGIIAENSRGVVIENNEIDGMKAYGIMLKTSADAVVQGNRVHNSGYGLAFVLGTSPSTAIDNTIIEPKGTGIDVIGDSPVLRNNNVVRPTALALKVVDFKSPEGDTVRSQPFLEGNNFDAKGIVVATRDAARQASPAPAPAPDAARQ
ncbi:MAG TPA: right-handed parallel beta-helix repeat-containing protein [Steroidobacteraceae bacterium]|nr:right-handed parallel beta-helix repeat-containing protein [Steroidobacteraceae bacterium]